jgi:hypothetical protein
MMSMEASVWASSWIAERGDSSSMTTPGGFGCWCRCIIAISDNRAIKLDYSHL